MLDLPVCFSSDRLMRSRRKCRRATANLSPSQRKGRGWRGLKPGRTALCPSPSTRSHLVRVTGICLSLYCLMSSVSNLLIWKSGLQKKGTFASILGHTNGHYCKESLYVKYFTILPFVLIWIIMSYSSWKIQYLNMLENNIKLNKKKVWYRNVDRKLIYCWPWCYSAWLASQPAWPEPHRESIEDCQEEDERYQTQ